MRIVEGKVDLMTLCDPALDEEREAGCDVRIEVDPHEIKALLGKLDLAIAQRDEYQQRLQDAALDALKLSKTHNAELLSRIAEQRETIDQLTESVAMWMDRAGARAP